METQQSEVHVMQQPLEPLSLYRVAPGHEVSEELAEIEIGVLGFAEKPLEFHAGLDCFYGAWPQQI